MNLIDLLNGLSPVETRGDTNIEVTGITKDSRAVRKGFVYISTGKGGTYLEDARKKGADVLVTNREHPGITFPCTIIVDDPEKWPGQMASRFYAYPSRNMHIAGVTGTNGKTTVTFLIESILKYAGKKPGVIGTITYRYGDHVIKAENTTPGAVEIQALLNQMHASGVRDVIMEVSSHALHQRRVEAVEFDVAIFTNLTHDHLDYHLNLENYKKAKKLLFEDYLATSVKEKKYAILNIDDPAIKDFAPKAPVKVFSYSTRGYADAHLIRYEEGIEGLQFTASLLGREIEISSPMIGAFNASNILASMLYGVVTDIPFSRIKEGIERLQGVPGRLERINNSRGIAVFVDYAHTPDALNNVLLLLKRLKKGKLIVVFGCGGDRDTSKRPVMGNVATSTADFSIITSDNPRSENPLHIIDEIRKGVNGNPYKVVENRKEAIEEALRMARQDDVILIAGKGHEDYQKIGDMTYHFSDKEVVEEALRVAT
ncbi:MAG TPA: UDP-N-acetylmuramoyl-L-alanyl-D-glutamate--2,6-diaminopimelate ligase [Syntrophorhabdaceae bacterium]|nr:UDP-N-acetylmuramoyl-L-alanyl-D-glutamate--2,6-diaminopimelate ligase [Syntrophorhabdaceae bacterium]